MAAVSQLPCGIIVFPGLPRTGLSTDEHEAVLNDEGHPLHQLLKTCDRLGIGAGDVGSWPASETADDRALRMLRTDFMLQLFTPAAQTRRWRRIREDHPELDARALRGMRFICADDLQHEADIIACLMREALETPDRTAMLVTPDRKLARQVRAALLKWGLDIEDSAGVDLARTRTGEYLLLLAEWFSQPDDVRALLAVLKHPLASGGLSRPVFSAQLRKLERLLLRGYLRARGLSGIKEQLALHHKDTELEGFFEAHVIKPLAALSALCEAPGPSLAQLADALGRAAEQLAQNDIANEGLLRLWDTPDGRVGVSVLSGLAEGAEANIIRPADFASVLRAVFSDQIVRKSWRSHARLSILGTVEARMQTADLIILGGLNDGVWPPHEQTDPWTNQTVRQALGMPGKRWRTGLAAHDFFMLASHPQVVLTRAARADDAPATPSRWTERMQAVLAAAALGSDLPRSVPASVAAGLNLCKQLPVKPADSPAPCPELALRPRRFSATDFDIWISDPYQIYARKILRLRALDPPGKKPDAALRGTLVHRILAEFLNDYPDGALPEDAREQLLARADTAFAPYKFHPPVQLFWQDKFTTVCDWFIANETERRAFITRSYPEIEGSMTINAPGGPVYVRARADRLDLGSGGPPVLIDYKTGSPPPAKAVKDGRATQMLVESAILAAGGFNIRLPEDHLSDICLEYWQLSGHRTREARITSVTLDSDDLARIEEKIADLIYCYDNPEQPYFSEPDPDSRPRFSDYRHLARIREWRPQEVEDD